MPRRITLLVLVALPLAPPCGAQAPSPFATRKAESLLETQLPCLGCHALNGRGGTIGPDLSTVRTRRTPAYIAAMIDDPQRIVPGAAMPRTLMPRTTRDLLVAYLASRPGSATVDAPAATPPAAPVPGDSAQVYARFCAACHGAAGRGDGPNARNLPVKPSAHASADSMSLRPDDTLFDTIAGGGLIMNRSARMPAFGATLTREQIRGLVGYIRVLCRCRPPAWSVPSP